MLVAVTALAKGQQYVEQGLISPTNHLTPVDLLSAREFDVFCLLAKGLTTKEIASQLCLSHKTASNYSTQIKNHLHVSTIAVSTRIAMTAGIL